LKSIFVPILAGAAALGITLAVTPASATPSTDFMSTFTQSNLPGFATGTFGTLDIHFDGACTVTGTTGNCATATFTAASGFAFANGADLADLNTISSVTSFHAVTPSTGFSGSFSGGNADGFGAFALNTSCTGACAALPPFSTAQYIVDGTFTSQNILTGNSQGFDAAIHILNVSAGGPSQGMTGFAVEPVPAPIIGHGLLVLLAVGGVLFGGKLLEHSKRRSSLGTA